MISLTFYCEIIIPHTYNIIHHHKMKTNTNVLAHTHVQLYVKTMKHHERSEIVALWGCNIIYALSTTQEMKAVLGKCVRPNTYLILADWMNLFFIFTFFSILFFIFIDLFIIYLCLLPYSFYFILFYRRHIIL